MTLRPIYADPVLLEEDTPRPPEIVGHFKTEALTYSCDDRDIEGNGSGGAGRGSGVARTARGRWLRFIWSNWSNEVHQTYYDATPGQVRDWLLANDEQGALRQWFPDLPEEDDRPGPGRPGIDGPVINFKPGPELLEFLDAQAAEQGISRAEMIRVLLGEAMIADRPYAITFRDISNNRREAAPGRYATLGAAAEALRQVDAEDDDSMSRGLPSCQPRVEFHGRPVDLEEPAG